MAVGGAVAAGLAGGCSTADSYMDPSVIGRWEYTPTTVQVLTYISSIEERPQELVDFGMVTTDDLLPNPSDYRLGPGDRVEVKIYGIVQSDIREEFQRVVDIRGLIDIPQLGRFYVNGKNVPQAKAMIEEKAKTLRADPLVELDVLESRQQTFSLVGGVERPGTYLIPRPDFRALEGLSNGGQISPSARHFDVIRTVTLDSALENPTGAPPPDAVPEVGAGKPATTGNGDELLRTINELGGGEKPPAEKAPAEKPVNEKPSPSVMAGNGALRLADRQPGGRDPVVDLVEPGQTATPKTPEPKAATPQPATPEPITAPATAPWVFVNGKWTQVKAERQADGGEPAFPGQNRSAREIVTQRVIRVPRDRLEAGDSAVNVILRPGDVVRVPEPVRGVFYVGGTVRRGGSFVLPEEGRMTILRAIETAGGLDALAWPERAELIRSLGEGRQAIVSFNLRAIAEGTQPDIYVKPDDQIRIGTSFWATPLAVIRNGFRASYGFGFLLDRNFGTDLLGMPPEYKNRGRNPLPF